MLTRGVKVYEPAENTEDEIHDEESTQDHHGDEVDPLPRIAHGIFNLCVAFRTFISYVVSKTRGGIIKEEEP